MHHGECGMWTRHCVLALLLLAVFQFGQMTTLAADAGSDPATAGRPGPVEAETALTQFVLPDDLTIELVAAEPDVIDPVAMTFGPDGKLWVVEMSDYPNGPPEDGPPLSRVRVLSDADGDGRYTDPVTYADKLLFANGLMLWRDGVLVTTDGEVLFLRDTDGDLQADVREVWFRGFKKDNPQLRANHPTLGLDNHIYIASGLRGGEVIAVRPEWAKEAKPVSLSSRDFRFDPLTGHYEAISGAGQFGLCFDDFGNRFVCSNRNPCSHIVLEDRYLARNPHLAVSQVHEDVSPAAENSRLYPISRIWTTSNLHANQFTAACGLLIYRGDALPEQYFGNSFTCEPTSNLVHRDVLTPKGATFESRPGREGVEFLATKDEWFRPVNLTHGPDGALYVVDMYRAVIEHPEFMPVELKTRPDLTDGNDRGRIYRIVPRTRLSSTRPLQQFDLARDETPELVERLTSTNPWVRDTAARLLLERQDAAAIKPLKELAHAAEPATQVHALWLLDGLDALSRSDVATALNAKSARVREQALILAELRFATDPEFRDRCLQILTDPTGDGKLMFQAALSLGSFSLADRTFPVFALSSALQRAPQDRWLRNAVAMSADDLLPDVLQAVIGPSKSGIPSLAPAAVETQLPLIEQYAEILGARNAPGLGNVLQSLLESAVQQGDVDGQRRAFAVLRGVSRGLRRSGGRLQQVAPAGSDQSISAVDAAIHAAAVLAADESQPAQARVEAAAVLGDAPSEIAVKALAPLVRASGDQQLTLTAIEALARHDDAQVPALLLEGFRQRTPQLRSAILTALNSPARLTALLDEIEAGRISPRDLDASIAQRFARISDPELKARADKLVSLTVDRDRQSVIDRYRAALQLPHDFERGREVFRANCAVCHRVGEVGVNVGADISDTRTKTPEQLLANILDPNLAVDGNYFGYSLVDTSGQVFTGIIVTETASSITLRQQEAKEVTILRRDVEELTSTGMSLMPVGLEKNIDLQQMADLIGYLKNWRYVDGAVPSQVLTGGGDSAE